MATCFLNNVFCLYLPAHTSHGLQPWDNGPSAVLKGAYCKALAKLSSLNDSTSGGKIQFMRCLIEARNAVTPTVLKGGWRHTGTWPISRQKALRHPEIQADREKRKADQMEDESGHSDSEFEPVSHEFITKLGRDRDFEDRRKLRKVANYTEDLQAQVILLKQEIMGYQSQIKNLTRGKKRKSIPNPNKRFQNISTIISQGGNPNQSPEVSSSSEDSGGSSDSSGDDEGSSDGQVVVDDPVRNLPPSRSGRARQLPSRYR